MLKVEDIHFGYQGKQILDGINMRLDDGEIVGLVGPNGTGKTTLLRLITGVLKPDEGRIVIGDVDVSTFSSGERAKLVAVVPQYPLLPLSFRVIDLVLMGRNPHLGLLRSEGPSDLETAYRAMSLTNVEHLADRTLETLSGGERQRAVVAMALAQETPLLLMDEPTSSLDLSHQTRVLDMIVDVQEKRGGAVLIAMHDLTLAAQYCDRVVMLSQGTVHAEGPPQNVLTAENIGEVYDTEVFVMSHPTEGTPVVVGTRRRD